MQKVIQIIGKTGILTSTLDYSRLDAMMYTSNIRKKIENLIESFFINLNIIEQYDIDNKYKIYIVLVALYKANIIKYESFKSQMSKLRECGDNNNYEHFLSKRKNFDIKLINNKSNFLGISYYDASLELLSKNKIERVSLDYLVEFLIFYKPSKNINHTYNKLFVEVFVKYIKMFLMSNDKNQLSLITDGILPLFVRKDGLDGNEVEVKDILTKDSYELYIKEMIRLFDISRPKKNEYWNGLLNYLIYHGEKGIHRMSLSTSTPITVRELLTDNKI